MKMGEAAAPALTPGVPMRRTMKTGEFHGTRRETHRHAGLTMAETEYIPGHRLPEHAHEHPFFSLLVRGSFREDLKRGSRDCIPTSLVFYPEHEPHEEAFGENGGRSFHVELGSTWLNRMRDEGMAYAAGSSETLTGRRNLLMTRLYAWFLSRGPSITAEEIVLELLAEVTRTTHLGREPSAPAWLERMRELLHARYREVVRVSELADEAGVHPVHAARVFRRHFGCTIGEYVLTLRIEDACAALGDPNESLSMIALATGFSDQAHFTRRFKEATGLPPGAYRRLVNH